MEKKLETMEKKGKIRRKKGIKNYENLKETRKIEKKGKMRRKKEMKN